MLLHLRKLMLLAALSAAMLVGFKAPKAQADQITIDVVSEASVKVQIEFYSQDRSVAWPGNGMAWDLNDYQRHTYTLNCRSGEQICFGAWVTGNSSRYWGVGANNSHGCQKCCFTCGAGNYPTQILYE
jgi:hypothetical protein